jgi:homocysteine S-methyltransferase
VLAALPNVGLATMTGARISFPHATPEYFGDFAASARSLGARLIGGCCGTTPAQIAAIRQAVDEDRPARTASPVRGRESVPAPVSDEEPTELARLFAAGEFVVSVQLDPPLGGSIRGLIEAARTIRESGKAHIVDVNDNPRARDRSGPPPHATRFDDCGTRVASARLARRRSSERARGHRRRARSG